MTGSEGNTRSTCLFFFSSLGRSGISGQPSNATPATGSGIWKGWKVSGLEGEGGKAMAYSSSFLLQFILLMIPSEMALTKKHEAADPTMQSLLKLQHPLSP